MAGMNVSITLSLQDQFSGPLKAVQAQLQGLANTAKAITAGFANVGQPFAGLGRQVQGLQQQMRALTASAQQLQTAISRPVGGGMFGGQQLAGMQRVLQMQQQMIANAQRLNQVQGTPRGGGSAPNSWLGRNGFNPNASLIDRAQYRGVNLAEQTFAEGALGIDKARTGLMMKGVADATRAQAEVFAAEWARQYPELTRSGITDTIGEIVTQFKNDADAFKLMPELLDIQRLGVYGGESYQNASKGMLSLVRALGITGRLTDNEGNINVKESKQWLDAFKRAKIIGGADITADQAFQAAKYMKTTGQTLTADAWLEAMIAMPDLRGNTYGNQLNMMRKQLTGTATKEALQAQAKAGLIDGAIDPKSPAGPNKFKYGATKDAELLMENPSQWIRTHLMEGYLQKQLGFDLKTVKPSEVATALKPLFSNSSAENIVNMIVNQLAEWQNQVRRAKALNIDDPKYWKDLRGQSGWVGLQEVRAQLVNVMSSISENFKFLLPVVHSVSDAMGKLAGILDPKTGNAAARAGLIGGGLIGGGLLARSLLSRVGPLGRMIAGGATGGLLGGDITSILLGGLMARGLGMGGGSIAGAAGAGVLARTIGGMAGLIKGLFVTSIAGLGISLMAGLGQEMWQGWDKNKPLLDNIGGSLKKYFTDLREDLAKSVNGIFSTPAEAAEKGKPGHEQPGGRSQWEIWQQESAERLRERMENAQPRSRFFDAITGLGGFIWRNTFGSTPAEGAGLQGPQVPGTTLGQMPGGLSGMPNLASIGTQIESAAAQAAAQITAAGSTLAGAINGVAAAASAAGARLGAIGPAGIGPLGNQSRSTLGDK